MKRMFMTLAAAGLAVAAGSANADPGGFAPPRPQGGGSPVMPAGGQSGGDPNTLMGVVGSRPNKEPDRYGVLPSLRKLFRVKKDACDPNGFPCAGPAVGHGPATGGYGGYDMGPPPVQQGTLVFPHHTFVRSPRDFFMYEPGPGR